MGQIKSVLFQYRSRRLWMSLLAGLLAIIVISVLWISNDTKEIQVHLTIDGEERMINTTANDVAEFIESEGLHIGEYDDISKSLASKLKDGDDLEIEHAKAIQLIDRGAWQVRYTTAPTVKEALATWGVELGEYDELNFDLNDPIDEHDTIQIDRIAYTYEQQTEEIPYGTVEEPTEQLLQGKTDIKQYGQVGAKERVIQKEWKNGLLTSMKIIKESVLEESVDQIVAVGTKSEVSVLSSSSQDIDQVTKDGITFGVKNVHDNVTLTAYDAGFNSTGKTEDHPQYGMTFTGTTVEEGRTVAVDPNVIPLGWWIYIEGYGFRKAEDTGSAVKGKKVDIYVETEEEADQFGLKKGYTVYVIGPNKPAGL